MEDNAASAKHDAWCRCVKVNKERQVAGSYSSVVSALMVGSSYALDGGDIGVNFRETRSDGCLSGLWELSQEPHDNILLWDERSMGKEKRRN